MVSFDVNALRGKLLVEASSMFGGKTDALIDYARAVTDHSRFSVEAFNHVINVREDRLRSKTRDADGINLSFPATKVGHSSGILQRVTEIEREQRKRVDVVLVDEGNFFDSGIVGVSYSLTQAGKVVVVAGLDLDFRGEGFGPMPILMKLADRLNIHKPFCNLERDGEHCSDGATYTARLHKTPGGEVAFYKKEDGRMVRHNGYSFAPYFDPTILPEDEGDDETSYVVSCRNCFKVPYGDETKGIRRRIAEKPGIKLEDLRRAFPDFEHLDDAVRFLVAENRAQEVDGRYYNVI